MRNDKRDDHLRSVATALDLISALSVSQVPLRVNETARRLGVAPATAHRLLSTFVANGFAVPAADGPGYRPGPSLLRLRAGHQLPVGALREAARPVLDRLSRSTGESVHLSILEGLDVVGIEHMAGGKSAVFIHPVGSRVPSHATAVGHALLAYRPDALEALIQEGLTQLTDATIAHGAALRHSLAGVRRRGYAINEGQWHAETAGVAAPILDSRGEALAAVGISGPAARVGGRPSLARLGRLARGAAREVSTRLPKQALDVHK
jgi:DNA-binding IclR family transcriptional regulator